MSHNQDENTLHFNDADVVNLTSTRVPAHDARVEIYPSSPASGLACIRSEGPVLLSVADVVALRDFLNLALEQAGVEAPTLYSLTREDVEEYAGRKLTDDEAGDFTETFPLTTVDQCVSGWLEGAGIGPNETPDASYCRHCRRSIVLDPKEGWIDPEAGYDDDNDGIWRTTCDAHDAFQADHEPINEDDLDFARETLGPDALPYHVVELALERADRDGKEIC